MTLNKAFTITGWFYLRFVKDEDGPAVSSGRLVVRRSAAEGAVAVAEEVERPRCAAVRVGACRRGQRRRIAPQGADRRGDRLRICVSLEQRMEHRCARRSI